MSRDAEPRPPPPGHRPDVPCLVADIGGTHARFGWLAGGEAPVAHVRILAAAGHAGMLEAAQAYLEGLRAQLGEQFAPPVHASLAVATAVVGDRIAFTNSHWSFSRRALQDALSLQSLTVLNDFEALALALPRLQASQMRLHGQPLRPGMPLAVVGPGTGLGVSCAVPHAGGWMALPGEGGHATLAAGDAFEDAVLAHARREHPHVSAERLLSGTGLPLLHRAVSAAEGQSAPTLDAPQIVAGGLAGEPRCQRTLEVFCALLGSFAGNVALTMGARGGLFVGGGLAPRLGDFFFRSAFRERFEAKGRLRPYLADIPTAVITDPAAALAGAATRLTAPGLNP